MPRPRAVRGLRLPAFLAVGFALLAPAIAGPTGAAGDPPAVHPTLRDFLPTSKYEFVSEPKLERATQVFFSARAASYLIRGSALGMPLLVRTGSGALIESVPEEALVDRPDGGFDLKADAKPKEIGRFRIAENRRDVVIDVKDLVKGRLTPPAPLLGWQRSASLVVHSPEYERDAKAYPVNEDSIRAIKAMPVRIRAADRETDPAKKAKGQVRVFVYFGSWCPICSTVMGKVIRVEQELTKDMPAAAEGEQPEIQFDYYGLPPEPDTWEDKEIKGRDIDILPTGMVYVDAKLCCKITGEAWDQPEAAIRRVLEKR